MDIKHLAMILLIGRIISLYFISDVLRKQFALLRERPLHVETDYVRQGRMIVLALLSVIFLFNIPPLIIDILTLFIDTGRPASVPPISVVYTFSFNGSFVLLSLFVWMFHKIAVRKDK